MDRIVHADDGPRPTRALVLSGGVGLGAYQTGRALHAGFLAPEPSGDTTGGLFESVPDGAGVSGGWRVSARGGDEPLVALTSTAALPVEMASLPLRLADLDPTATCRLLDGPAPAGPPGPASR